MRRWYLYLRARILWRPVHRLPTRMRAQHGLFPRPGMRTKQMHGSVPGYLRAERSVQRDQSHADVQLPTRYRWQCVHLLRRDERYERELVINDVHNGKRYLQDKPNKTVNSPTGSPARDKTVQPESLRPEQHMSRIKWTSGVHLRARVPRIAASLSTRVHSQF